jgi:hypothetical protein
MLELATLSGDTLTKAIALVRIGVELLRDENSQALYYLEAAKDLTFEVRSRELTAYVFAMLARGYATFHREQDFLRSTDIALTYANDMRGLPVATKDHIYHAYSAIVEEKANGLLLFGHGKKAIEELIETNKQATVENNAYLKMWLPLDYAQGYLLQGEVEESVKHLEAFYLGIGDYDSDRIKSKVQLHLTSLETQGYASLPIVRNFQQKYFEKGH